MVSMVSLLELCLKVHLSNPQLSGELELLYISCLFLCSQLYILEILSLLLVIIANTES